MHIVLFLMISTLFLEQMGRLFLYQKFDFIINIFGNFIGSIFYISGLLAIGLSIFILYKKIKTKELKLEKWDILFALMMLWGLLSVLFSTDKQLVFIGTDYRMDGYFSYLIYAAMYIGCRTLKSDRIKLWIIRAFSAVITSLCFDFICTGSNLSIFSNRNHFAYVLTISCMLLAGLFIYEKKWFVRILYIIMYIINIYTMVYADTFGSYLGIMFALFFTIIFLCFIKKELIIYSLITFILFVGISVFVDSKTNIVSDNFRSLGIDFGRISTNAPDIDKAGNSRILLWKLSFRYISQKPLFGYGPEGTHYMFLDDTDYANDRPHNEYIQHALFMGIPASLFYMGGLLLIFISTLKNRKRLPNYAFISGIAVFAYCISAFFGNTMYYTSPYFFMILGMVSKPVIEKK